MFWKAMHHLPRGDHVETPPARRDHGQAGRLDGARPRDGDDRVHSVRPPAAHAADAGPAGRRHDRGQRGHCARAPHDAAVPARRPARTAVSSRATACPRVWRRQGYAAAAVWRARRHGEPLGVCAYQAQRAWRGCGAVRRKRRQAVQSGPPYARASDARRPQGKPGALRGRQQL